MDTLTILVILNVSIALINFLFALLRTYYARYAKKTYVGSVNYWASWQKRKYDVAAQVLKEMGLDSPEDMKKLVKVIKKETKKKGKK